MSVNSRADQIPTNKVYLGWSGTRLKAQVDTADLGNIVFDGNLDGAFANRIAVVTGTIGDGGTIPLPAGFTEGQCKWMVSMSSDNPNLKVWDIDEGSQNVHYRFECSTNGRVVNAKVYRKWQGGTSDVVTSVANYIIVGVK